MTAGTGVGAPDVLLVVVGTRPEAIKLGPVIRALRAAPDRFRTVVCATGQHRELLDGALGLFDVAPDHDLAVMRAGQTPTDVAAAVLQGLAPVLAAERPAWVLVQGDTTTALAGALAAAYAGIGIGHVEAGLRTGDKRQPFPEEINRRLIGAAADLHFAPTARAAAHLRSEGVAAAQIVVTGNTVVDAIRYVASLPFDPRGTPLEPLAASDRRIVLATAHRRESFGAGIAGICRGLRAIAARFADVEVVSPVHPNPHVAGPVRRLLEGAARVTLLPPLGYREMAWLLQRSCLVVTDSGGLQEEAPGLGKPTLVLRRATERPEGIEAGVARLVGADPARILGEASRLLADPVAYAAMAGRANPYGDGRAAERIVGALAAAEPVRNLLADVAESRR